MSYSKVINKSNKDREGPCQLILKVLGSALPFTQLVLCFSKAAKRWNRVVLNNKSETPIEHAQYISIGIQFIIFN